jgi:hypothetical protein
VGPVGRHDRVHAELRTLEEAQDLVDRRRLPEHDAVVAQLAWRELLAGLRSDQEDRLPGATEVVLEGADSWSRELLLRGRDDDDVGVRRERAPSCSRTSGLTTVALVLQVLLRLP